jgi:MSHA pilin protein MshD
MFSSSAVRQRGVTLIELIVFIVIVGVAVVSILGVLSLTTRNSADPLRHKQALMIAEGLLEEVELANFTYCDPNSADAGSATSVAACGTPEMFGPEMNDARPYDNVNDYGGSLTRFYNAANQLADANGNPIGVNGYDATVNIVPETLNGIAGGTTADPDVLRITVTVTYDGGQTVSLDGYRTRYAPQIQ